MQLLQSKGPIRLLRTGPSFLIIYLRIFRIENFVKFHASLRRNLFMVF
jgi:hypothetical protein